MITYLHADEIDNPISSLSDTLNNVLVMMKKQYKNRESPGSRMSSSDFATIGSSVDTVMDCLLSLESSQLAFASPLLSKETQNLIINQRAINSVSLH